MFNLVDESWIPVERADGRAVELSLAAVFADAPQLRGLALPFPPERVALTRILVAVLGSALRGPSGSAERAQWLQGHAATAERVAEYLDRWRHRFDVFDAEHPFMQRPISDEFADQPVNVLRLDWASGNNATLFDHHSDDRPAVLMPGEAVRALLTTLLYQPGGGVAKPFNRTDSPGTKPLMVLVDGDDLWETLVANAPTLDGDRADAPIWERDDDHTPDKEGTVPLGWLDLATWRSRAVLLLRDDDGAVRRCRLHQHLKLADAPPFDPFAPRLRVEGQEPEIVRLRAGKRLWRTADAILRGLTGRTHRTVVADALATFDRLEVPRRPRVLVVGLQVNQAKVGDAQSAVLPVSRALLEDEARIDFVTWQIEVAEQGAKALRSAAGAYRVALGAALESAASRAWEAPYWPSLAAEFSAALEQVAQAPTTPVAGDKTHGAAWIQVVRRRALRAFEEQATHAVAGPRQARALARARHALLRSLPSIPTNHAEAA